ncbi:MAG: hypothetical protein RLN62_07210 [Rickettsiales bacterium]
MYEEVFGELACDIETQANYLIKLSEKVNQIRILMMRSEYD